MKTGAFILILFGALLTAYFYMAPTTPRKERAETETNTTPAEQQPTPDEQVDQALAELQSGTTPPMQAILKIRQVAKEHPENVKAQFTLGQLSMQTGQYEKATARFEAVVDLQPESNDAWRALAEAQMMSGDTARAKSSLMKAVALSDEETGNRFKEELQGLHVN